MAEDGAYGQVAEAGTEPLLEAELGEEALEYDQAREGSESLIFEPDGWDLVGLSVNVGSAIFHPGWSPL
jgi:hypothetical protein